MKTLPQFVSHLRSRIKCHQVQIVAEIIHQANLRFFYKGAMNTLRLVSDFTWGVHPMDGVMELTHI